MYARVPTHDLLPRNNRSLCPTCPDMKISADHLKRYQQIAQLLWKYGRSDLVTQMNAAHGIGADEVAPRSTAEVMPAQLADDLEAMGPTYVKLGQVLSSRPD